MLPLIFLPEPTAGNPENKAGILPKIRRIPASISYSGLYLSSSFNSSSTAAFN